MRKNKVLKSKKCPCCLFDTVEEDYEICPICFWENDPLQRKNPNSSSGANKISLNIARTNFIKFGASQEEFINRTRKPTKEDKKN